MTTETPVTDDVTLLAKRVAQARGRLAYQFDPALTEALSEYELTAERELAERIRESERMQRWKQAQAAAAASDRARQTTEQIEKADIRDLLLARKAIAAQRRESSPHAKLASLYRHRAWSLRALAGVVAAGMLWSAVNVQHNIAPGGASDPLYWFSYLLEGMISVCLVIIMTGTNKVAEWGVSNSRHQVAVAEAALLGLTVTLNTYPYLRGEQWYNVGVHAVAPVMIGVALLIHNAASERYGSAIARATDQVRDLPDPAEQIRLTLSSLGSYRASLMENAAEAEAGGDTDAAPDADVIDTAALDTATADPTRSGETRSDKARSAKARSDKAPGDKATDDKANADKATVDTSVAAVNEARTEPITVTSTDSDTAVAAWTEWTAAPDTASTNGSDQTADAATEVVNSYAAQVDKALASVYVSDTTSTGQFRVAESLEHELAELQAARRRARSGK